MNRILRLFCVMICTVILLADAHAAPAQAGTVSLSALDTAMTAYTAQLADAYDPYFHYYSRSNSTFIRTVDNIETGTGAVTRALINLGGFLVEQGGDFDSSKIETQMYVELLLDLAEFAHMPFSEALADLDPQRSDADLMLKILKLSIKAGSTLSGLQDNPLSTYDDLFPELVKSSDPLVKTLLYESTADQAASFAASLLNTSVSSAAEMAAEQGLKYLASLEHVHYVSSSIPLFETIAHYSTDPELTAAANALCSCYRSWLDSLDTADPSALTGDLLQDRGVLNNQMQDHIRAYIREHETMHALSAISFLTKVGVSTVFSVAAGGFETVIAAGDLLFGTTDTYTHFHEMKCAKYIFESLQRCCDAALTQSGIYWKDRLAYTRQYQLLLRAIAIGESALHAMTSSDEGLIQALLSDNAELSEKWYQMAMDRLEIAYSGTERYMQEIEAYCNEQIGRGADIHALTQRDDVITETLSGVITHDDFFALPASPSLPDLSRPDPLAMLAAEGVSVELIGEDEYGDDMVLDQTTTDAAGAYSFTYPRSTSEYQTLSLRLSGGSYSEKTIPALRKQAITFRSAFPSEASMLESGVDASVSGQTHLTSFFPCSDSFFLSDPSQYHHELARLSLGVSAAAFSSADVEEDYAGSSSFRDENIWDALYALGFGDLESYHYDVTLNDFQDKTAFSIACREIANPNVPDDQDQRELVLAVVVRGGGYGGEWSSNFHVGTQTDHAGFSAAADDVVSALEAYIDAYADESMPLKIWLTGFSRGGAVANLAAARIQARIPCEALFAYTFAAPNCTRAPIQAAPHCGIFNVIYDEDLVPRAAFERWGYARHGKTLAFSGENGSLNDEQLDAVSARFSGITMHAGYTFDPRDVLENSTLENSLIRLLTDQISSAEDYQALEPYVRAAIAYFQIKVEDDDGALVSDAAHRHAYVESLRASSASGSLLHSLLRKDTLSRKDLLAVHQTLNDLLPGSGLLLDPQDSQFQTMLLDLHTLACQFGCELSFSQSITQILTVLLARFPSLLDTAYLGMLSFEASTATLDSILTAHHPEIYMAFMQTHDSQTLFGEEAVSGLNARVMRTETAAVIGGRLSLGSGFIGEDRILEEMDITDSGYALVPQTFDIDGDGTEECAFFDQYGMSDYMIIQFLPASMREKPHAAFGQYPYLFPGIQYCDAQGYLDPNLAGDLYPMGKEYHRLSIITGRDGRVYACALGNVFGANGWPEVFPEFFMQTDGSAELVPIKPDYERFLLSEANGVKLDRYTANFFEQYAEELGGWVYTMTQIDHEGHDRLYTFLTMEDGELVLLARYLDRERIE